MITFTELVDEMLRSTSRRRRNNKSRTESGQDAPGDTMSASASKASSGDGDSEPPRSN